jgi:hypothetical protein
VVLASARTVVCSSAVVPGAPVLVLVLAPGRAVEPMVAALVDAVCMVVLPAPPVGGGSPTQPLEAPKIKERASEDV